MMKTQKSADNMDWQRKEFSVHKNAFMRQYRGLNKNYWIAMWDYDTNSTDENKNKYSCASAKFDALLSDNKVRSKFESINPENLSESQQRYLKRILDKLSDPAQQGDNELGKITLNISQKYSSYIPIINGKEVSLPEIQSVLKKEKDQDVRKSFYEAKVRGGDLIAEDIRQLVIKRNEYAVSKGYKNFFEYIAKINYLVDVEELKKLLESIYLNMSEQLTRVLYERKYTLQQTFNIDRLAPYHYEFLLDNGAERKANEYIKDVNQVIEIAKKTYKGMGYDIDKLIREGKLTMDLLPRKNKNSHGFTFWCAPCKDNRILANLTNDINSLRTLNHELGHCMYGLNYSRNLCFFDKIAYYPITEAVSDMIGDIHKRENILKDILPCHLLQELKDEYITDEILRMSRQMGLNEFEMKMYENPEQDLSVLWRDIRVKYMGADMDEKPDNQWATIPLFLTHVSYCQNYIRASIMKAQIYDYLHSKLGDITDNPKTAHCLNSGLFRYGRSLSEDELIEKFTGKKLSQEAFIKSLSR